MAKVDLLVHGLDKDVVMDFKELAEELGLEPSELLEGLMREFVKAEEEEKALESNSKEGGDV